MSDVLTTHERDVLTTLCGGPDKIGSWGAWVGACIESLQGAGLLTRGLHAVPTDKGRALAAEIMAEGAA